MTPTIFLLEGADATGKSSAISQAVIHAAMADLPEPRVIHNTADDHKLPGSLYRHYKAQLLDAIDFRDKHGISTYIDRSFVSEVIYGGLYRGKSRLTIRQAHRLERLASKHGIVLLGMTADLNTRRRRMLGRGETWDNQQPFVGAFYHQWFRERRAYWITADSSSANAFTQE